MNKVLFAAGALVLILIVGFFALNSYIYSEKQGTGETFEPYRATLTGEYVCLPHADQSGPQTLECAGGLRTDTGEHFAVDLSLMSQTHDPLETGQRFTASGTVTPLERLSADHWQKYDIEGIFSVTDSLVVDEPEEVYACNGDAKICPDGSSVGRRGPSCEFEACPPADATRAKVTTYMGGTATALTVSVSPQKLVSDSRCASGVTCIWAGTVEVRTILSTPVSHGEHVLTLGTPQVFGDYTVTLVEVTPEKDEDTIPDSSYRFTYEIVKTQ
jgi:hypothetical protein